DSNTVLSDDIYQSFSVLRSSVDALVCAADLIPSGGDDESMGHLFRVLAYRLEADLTSHLLALRLPRS
ncbi:hypothetical protein, partial [Escherichia coli]